MSIQVRLATTDDLSRINEIYNHYVLSSTSTYQEIPETMDSRIAWFGRHGETHPVTVAELDGRVVGWGSLSPFHPRSAFKFTTENSLYVDHAFQGRGGGRAILADLIARSDAIGYKVIVAAIDSAQPASLALHAKFGFETTGHLKRVGHKFGQWLDVIYMQRNV